MNWDSLPVWFKTIEEDPLRAWVLAFPWSNLSLFSGKVLLHDFRGSRPQ